MYFELFFPLALGSIGGIVYKKWQDYRVAEDNGYDDYEFCDEDWESCPLIMFEKNGNHYYVYE